MTQPNDAELIAAGWRRWGEGLLDRLRGRFAFAVADPTGPCVVLVTDPMSEIPVYYSRIPGAVVVSDDLAAVLRHPGVGNEVDLEAVALRSARCFSEVARRTDFHRIAKVASGTMVRICAEELREVVYWRPGQTQTRWTGSFDDAVEQGTDLLWQAVQDRVASAPMVGVHLSGGLDSSVVAAATATTAPPTRRPPPLAYCWSPEPSSEWGGDRDWQEYAGVCAVARCYNLDVTFADGEQLLAAIALGSEPLLDPPMAWHIEWGHAAHAAAHGVSTMVTGWGGDETLSLHSQTVAAELLRRGAPVKAWRATSAPPGQRRSVRSRLKRILTGGVPGGFQAYEQAVDAAWRRYRPDIADARLAQQSLIVNAGTTRARMLALLGNGHLAARNASWHRGGARFGVTYASPLQDRRIVDFALSLPPDYFTYNGVHRRLFRAIAARHLPQAVIDTQKVRGAESARARLSNALALAYREHDRAAGERLGWPPQLLEARAIMYAQLWQPA